MKSVLLHVNDDRALDDRLQFALDFCRAHDAHLTCLQTSMVEALAISQPLGGALLAGRIFEQLKAAAIQLRERLEAHLGREDIRWDWRVAEGDARQDLVAATGLEDVVIISQPNQGEGADRPLPIVHDIALGSLCPVLLVPAGTNRFVANTPAIVGWNGSPEASNAIRSALPALRLASKVIVVSVEERHQAFPQMAASTYLARHGVPTELQALKPGQWSPAEIMGDCARIRGAGLVVMGAYGRSRFREALLGGTTRSMLSNPPAPLLLHR